LHMWSVLHARDVCVGEQTNPWDISPNVATTRFATLRAGAACGAIARPRSSESTESELAKNDARKRMLDLSMRNAETVCTRNMRRVWYVLRHDSAWRAR